jgi:general secretion pathway protein A
MYLSHFGLSRLPFENVPDPAFFFDEGEYQRILRRLTSALGAGRGLMVVAGPIGAG